MTMDNAMPATGWQAHLQLGFQRRAQRTFLRQCTHQGPLQVQRPFYPEGEAVCHYGSQNCPNHGLSEHDPMPLPTCHPLKNCPNYCPIRQPF